MASLCGALLVASVAAPPANGAGNDPLAAGRRLARGVTPLAASSSGITRDVGHIAVIEHDGSNYVRSNIAARAAVAQRFYESHGDNYDFVVVFTNFDFDVGGDGTGETLAFYNAVRNNVRGIGLEPFDNGPLFGAPGRLSGFIDMAAIGRYRQPPLSVGPGSAGFVTTLNVLAHEIGHQWLSRVRYRDAAGTISSALLQEGSHWSYLLDSDASVMYGSDWTPNSNGSFTATRVDQGYSSLDLYLMGLLDPNKVLPFVLLRNPAIDPNQLPREGDVVQAVPETVTLPQVVAAEGARSPSFLHSPKAFRVGFVFLTSPGVDPDPADLQAVERVRGTFPAHFFALTRGRAIADTTLAEAPPVPLAPFPDLDRALAWLLARQGIDGRFEDSPLTAVRDTATAVEALLAAGVAGTPRERALAFLGGNPPPSVDYSARRASAIAVILSEDGRRQAAQGLLAQQNPDGGFGAARGFTSDALDTALALRALRALERPADAAVNDALRALAALASTDGGWPVVPGAPPSTVATAHVLLALLDWKDVPAASSLTASGMGFFVARRNADGGFGESPSTAYATALALEVLVRGGAAQELTNAAIAWLQSQQLSDGSWGGGRYPTALVLSALKGGVSPNLVVPADGIVFAPPEVREGEPAQVTARIANTGRTPAGPSEARLYDGNPATGDLLGEAPVPALAAGESATVTFQFSTQDRAGSRELFVVADAGDEIRESREDDNATPRTLQVTGLLPDLVILAGDLAATPNPAGDGDTVVVSVRVTNGGTKRSGLSQLWLFDGAPSAGGRLLGQAALDAIEKGASSLASFSWDTTGATGDHELWAVADATYGVNESDESNNQAILSISVGELPVGSDLAVESLTVTPASLSTLPQEVELRAVVRNLGSEPADSNVRFEADPPLGAPLGDVRVEIPPRSSKTVVIRATVATSGSRGLLATVDPDDELPETNEGNNQAGAFLEDPANTLDIEILPADVELSSSDLVAGDTLTVTALVRNRGTAPLTQVPLMLAVGAGADLRELSRELITLAPGAETSVVLSWLASITGDSVPLSLRADPFGLLQELSESNNVIEFAVKISASSLPDLIAPGGDILFDPDPPLEGAPATIKVRVKNPTPVAVVSPFTVAAYLGNPEDADSTLLGSAPVSGIEANGDIRVDVPWPSVDVRGTQGIFVVVDALGEVPEYDETNNTSFRPFGIQGLPDLVLTAGDMSVQPAFPRAGEAVTIRATLRNLGAQAAPGPFLVRAVEGEPTTGTTIGDQTIDGLAPGASHSLEFTWTPAAPPGARTLSLVADPDGAVSEQSRGNNVARRTVVVQNADLFLTAPYFSPDGDGLMDETSLGYRATGEVKLVVSNARGQLVRTLAERASAEGSITWDGRADDGRPLSDGPYTLTVEGAGGAVLGRISAVLDTDRSPIHEAAGTGLVAVQQLTNDRLPGVFDLAWMPQEEEALAIIRQAQGDFVQGLVRVGLDGSHSYVAKDPWYGSVDLFTSPDAVSPDGREMLLRLGRNWAFELYAVDLATGTRRFVVSIASGGIESRVSWSPDGRYIAAADKVVARDGTLLLDLPRREGGGSISSTAWSWSPDGRFLAEGDSIVSLDGDVRTIPIPDGLIDVGGGEGDPTFLNTAWRGDGKIHTVFGFCGDGCASEAPLLIDPDNGTVERHPVARGHWSPDGSRVLYPDFSGQTTVVAQQDGSGAIPLGSFVAEASPRSSLAWYGSCGECTFDSEWELFAVRNLLNLTAEFRAIQLPGGNGLLLRGIAADRNLDRYQLDYTEQANPEGWRPIGAASEVPVIDDVFGVWAPPKPGTYLLRLRAFDRAGNVETRVQVISWDRTPVLADLTQDEFLISPNGDAIKDAVTFHYIVQEPTRVEVRIAGPGEGGPTVRTLGIPYPEVGAGSFTWDGHDGAGAVVPDGRYTVFLNELPLRVDVDTTPPDVAWSYEKLRSVQDSGKACGNLIQIGAVQVDRLLHVVDTNLKRWFVERELYASGEEHEQVYEAETDANGRAILENGLRRIKRAGGRVVDKREVVAGDEAARLGASLVAEDYAGNKSILPIPPLAEKVFVLHTNPVEEDSAATCRALLKGIGRMLAPVSPDRVYSLRPRTDFYVGPVLRRRVAPPIRFQFRPAAGGPWSETQPTTPDIEALRLDFPALGLSPGPEYQGRFVVDSEGRTLVSEEFRFKLCDEFATLSVPEGGPLTVRFKLSEPVTEASVTVVGSGTLAGFRQEVRLTPSGAETFSASPVLPPTEAGCPGAGLSFEAELVGASGRRYKHDDRCFQLRAGDEPVPALEIIEDEPFCGSPDRIPLKIVGSPAGQRVTIERGPDDPGVMLGEVVSAPSPVEFDADVTGVPEGDVTIRARMHIAGNPDPKGCPTAEKVVFVDRTPPSASILQPAEGAWLCPSADPASGREIVTLVISASDRKRVGVVASEYRRGDGPWKAFELSCLGSKKECERFPPRFEPGTALPVGWDVTGLPEDEYTLRLTFCDGAGNTSTVARRLRLQREPPQLRLVEALAVFSPNGDGSFETAIVKAELFQAARLTADVRLGSEPGRILKTLFEDQTRAPGVQELTWDGSDVLGNVVVDGGYVLVVSARDACGRAAALSVPLTVDNTPPLALIATPHADDGVGPSVDVRGTATDDRFVSYELSYAVGEPPAQWVPIATRTSQVPGPLGFLGRWDTPSVPGFYTLRLVGLDAVGNQGQALVRVSVGDRRFLARVAATPDVFSPTGDGRRETTSLEYELVVPGKVTLEIRSAQGEVLRTLESGVQHPPGSYAFAWDGTRDNGNPAPEAEHVVSVHAEDLAGAEDQAITLVLDRTAPTITLHQPPPDAHVRSSESVVGSIADARMAAYLVQAAAQGGAPIELARGAQERTNATLATLAVLGDERYTLTVSAEDAAENRSSLDVAFTLDSSPPVVRLQVPSPAAVVRNGTPATEVIGSIADGNLQEWVLSFGRGDAPADGSLIEIARSTVGGSALLLASWPAVPLPDGTYTLVLVGRDRAGHAAEARVTVTLDGTPPVADISAPAGNACLRVPTDVVAVASDANLDSWTLESAAGAAATAFQWSRVAEGTTSIDGEALATWRLPPDGAHTLRLTVRDKAGHSSTALRSLVVDTTPPAAPTGLRADVLTETGEVVLTWDASTGLGLAMYRVLRGGEIIAEDLGSPTHADADAGEGTFDYQVVAVDCAGNPSEPATLRVRVDLTPPTVVISAPVADAAVTGQVNVRGTAFSLDDFKEYRLSVGTGEEPLNWTLLKRSTLPVAGSILGSWTAVGAGPHVLALEAEDLSGNLARTTLRVIVDNQPPLAPVLSSVFDPGAASDSLVPAWQASASQDVAGYLVERNGHIANAPALVLGDLRGYLVTGPSYLDAALPDGEHCYVVLAMDQAGNLSPPSNEICHSLDNREPHAILVEPPPGLKFEHPIRVIAFTPDTDVASVQFQVKPAADSAWTNLGAADTTAPFETTFDPAGRVFGEYDLGAVARDRGGSRPDPAPATTRVVYGDTTAPAPPSGLGAVVKGADATLTWTANSEPDIGGYHVNRDGQRLTPAPLSAPTFSDPGLSPGTYSYDVFAVDLDGNESPPSSVAALVYAVGIDPLFPVTGETATTLTGGGAQPGSVRIVREGTEVAAAPTAGEAWSVPAVPLAAGVNRLRAVGFDAAGNESLPSDEVVLISNAAPGLLAGLAAVLDGRDAVLTWQAAADADAFGYVVERDADRLTGSSPQTELAAIGASSGNSPWFAFDGDSATAWVPDALPATWTIGFYPGPALVERIRLRFDPTRPALSAYRVEAFWEGEFLPLAVVTGNASRDVVHAFPSAFATDTIQIVALASEGVPGLAEVEVTKLDAVAAAAPTSRDVVAPDGAHTYRVATIDRYGAVGPFTTAELALPVVLPEAPTGLVATVNGRDVQLTWTANAEPDVVKYAVQRDGVRIAETSAPGHLDAGLANGTYRYTVLAIDSAAQESSPSAPGIATVAVTPQPPAVPEIFFPAASGSTITLAATSTDVRGFADSGTLVTLEANGSHAGTALAEACAAGYVETARFEAPASYWQGVVSRDGKVLAFEWYDDVTGLAYLTVVDAQTGVRSEAAHPGAAWSGLLGQGGLNADGSQLAYLAVTAEAPSGGLYVLDRASGQRRLISEADWHQEQAFSPDGSRLAYVAGLGGERLLVVHELASGVSQVVLAVPADQYFASVRWSADSSRLLFYFVEGWPPQLRLLDVATGDMTTVDPNVGLGPSPDWSPDGLHVAYTQEDGRGVVHELATGASTDLGPGSALRFDPTGSRVSLFVSEPVGPSILVQDLTNGTRWTVASGPGLPASHEWTSAGTLILTLADHVGLFRSCARGMFEIQGVALAPGENRLVARALDPRTALVSSDSAPLVVNVAAATYPDLELATTDLTSYPALPLVSQATRLDLQVRNVGDAAAREARVRLRVLKPDQTIALEHATTLPELAGGARATVSVTFAPSLPGAYTLVASLDPDDLINETREDNNEARRSLTVAASGAPVVTLHADRSSYAARTPVSAQVSVLNPGPRFNGTARLTVEDTAGAEVALVDSRAVSLDYAQSLLYSVTWNTGTVYAGSYVLRLRVTDSGGAPTAQVEWPFFIEPDLVVAARLVADRPQVTAGAPATFEARLQNRGANVPLTSDSLTFRVLGAGASVFESAAPLPSLLPGGVALTSFVWPSAGPPGGYVAEVRVVAPDGSPRATAQAGLTVVAPPVDVTGRLTLAPRQVLAGDPTTAHLLLTNPAATAVSALSVSVQVTAGASASVLVSETTSVDLQPGETREVDLALGITSLAPGVYPVFLRASSRSLDRATLTVHAALGAPSVHAPADGAVVATARPTLVVNNATSPAGVPLTYEFQIFGDEALQQQLPGAQNVPEGDPRTSWTVFSALDEDRTFYWRARASDGFSSSPWTPVASFTVDEQNLPPSSPVIDSPAPGATVATRQPALVVRNASDAELAYLTYEFRLARDAEMTQIVAAASGVTETFGLTSWTPPVTLDEDATYYWSARSSDGVNLSSWTDAAAFLVDSENASPSAPVPLHPVDETAATTTPELVVSNARDPEGAPLVYRFEIDRAPSFDSPALQTSPEFPEGAGVTAWTPPLALLDNSRYYWRASAFDGRTAGPWASASFFVNLANDPPSVPAPVSPAAGEVVSTPTPTLRVRNAVDLDGDALAYDFEVKDAAGSVVASANGVAETATETAWTVDVALAENGTYVWSARARDAESASDWSAPQSFRVNAMQEPPTAPTLLSPPDGATVRERRPALTVQNATSPEGLSLSYAFEVYLEGPAGPTLVDAGAAVPEGTSTTSFTPNVDLADGAYSWRARAHDGVQPGPWMASARFVVAVDVPPAPPTGLTAAPGNASVQLNWTPSPEADVVGYRVYRGSATGGPYALVGETAAASFLDGGLANGVTVFYVITARDAAFESGYSAEVAATPQAPAVVTAEVRFAPDAIDAICLFGVCDRGNRSSREQHGHLPFRDGQAPAGAHHDDEHDDDDHDDDEHCPSLLRAAIELPAGYDPRAIDLQSVRLAGGIAPVRVARRLVDSDRDGIYERRFAFRFAEVARLLVGGVNTLRVTGRVSGHSFEGEGTLVVRPLSLDLKITPETLERRASGAAVRAHLDMDGGLRGADVDVASLRLQGSVPVKRVVNVSRDQVIVEFDRARVLALVPNGKRVTLVLTGRVDRVGLEARDVVRVKN